MNVERGQRRDAPIGGAVRSGLRETAITSCRSFVVHCLALAAVVGLGLALPRPGELRGEEPTASSTDSTSGDSAVRNPFLPPNVADRGWPHIRGANYDGRSPEIHLADEWPAAGPPVLWTRPLGQGYSGFAAFGDRVYTQMQSLAGQYVVCLDADTGETVWEHRYDWAYEPAGIYPGPRATPTYDSGRIYFAGPRGLVGCLDADDGRVIWSLDVNEKFQGRGTDFGYSISPTVTDGKVVLPVGGVGASVVALDADDGSLVWKSGDDPASYTPALPVEIGGAKRILALTQNKLSGYDLETGRHLWSIALSYGYDEHSSWPLYSEPLVLVSSCFGSGSAVYDVSADADVVVKPVWQSAILSNDIFSSVLVDGNIYGFDLKDPQAKAHRPSRGMFRCLDFRTGEERWHTDRTGHTTVLVADGKLILFNDRGELILAHASPDEYRELGRVQILGGEICWTQPTLHRGRLYVRNQSHAACLFLGEAERLRATAGATLSVADIPQSEYRDLASAILGVEPEYAFDVPTDEWLRDWFLISLGIFGATSLLTGTAVLAWPRIGTIGGWWLFWCLAFLLGAIGTTVISRARGEFTFTWPVCLFVAFQAMVHHSRWGAKRMVSRPRIWSYATAGLFLLVCTVYYLLCRRLSLVTEWGFLVGFPAAAPFAIASAMDRSAWNRALRCVWTIGWTTAAFAACYWSAVGLLAWKY